MVSENPFYPTLLCWPELYAWVTSWFKRKCLWRWWLMVA